MTKRKLIFTLTAIATLTIAISTILLSKPTDNDIITTKNIAKETGVKELPPQTTTHGSTNKPTPTPVIKFVGPRENIPADTPTAHGFWSFAVPVKDKLSRSGQPLLSEFKWLREQGWRSVIDLRTDGERGEVGDDAKIPGFNELDFNYKYMPLTDGHPPTEKQAKEFLAFVTNPANQPTHIHCRGGIGRAGTMTALYRYSVQGWPMKKAIEESRAFKGGVSTLQEPWLLEWAANHQKRAYQQ